MPPGSLSLKQRLAALAQSTSSPSTYDAEGSDSSFRSTIRRKAQAHAPWLRNMRQPEPTMDPTPDEMAQVQQVLSRMIFQAGVDYEVVLNASALPDPAVVSYDLLLSQILAYLNLYVEADYSVVFFAAGSRHTPGWNWVWKAYRSLSRKYRKNLKQLYIVHSSFFSKMLFSLAGAIISPKFFAKIVYISTLSELAYYVPLTQIDIPPEVYKENLKYEDRITLPTPSRSLVFGIPLEELMGYEGEKGLAEEGLFRRSPSSALLRAAQEAYDRGNVVSLETFGDPHLAAVLLKKFLRDLPEPIFPESLYPTIRACPLPSNDPNDMNAVMYIRESLLPYLTPCAYIVLSAILQLMHDVSLRGATNRMNDYNLAIVLTPNLVKGSNPIRDVSICAVAGAPALANMSPNQEGKTTLGTIIALCIRRYYEIFDDIPDYTDVASSTHLDPSYSQSSFLSSQLSPSSTPSEASYVIHDGEDDFFADDDLPPSASLPSGHRRGDSTQLQQQQQAALAAAAAAPPSAWAAGVPQNNGSGAKRHRTTPSGGTTSTTSGVRSVHTLQGDRANNGGAYQGRAKSLVSVDKVSPGHKKGTISVGRGTRKASGAAVGAVGVTAEGFFSPPKEGKVPPPIPPRPAAKASVSDDD
ncbi:hypothetical protein D9611_009519 [Ephemerocybe angulata]|uniref:Rho-GAP domain-containing protein n=1 Tax=Ephemerocybe angulata TaxID=980116 RepID=A0A8H5AVJ5_9AGAR|nr:hypothetical protein D9611_009519 [Tulosesus angulatus]